MRNKLIIFFLVLFTGCPAYAQNVNLSIGTSTNYLNISDPNYSFVGNDNQFELSSVIVGAAYKISQEQPIVIGLTTNRFLNKETSRQVVSKSNGLAFENRTKTLADTLSLGYQFGKFTPSLLISNADVKKILYYNNRKVGEDRQHTLLYGLGLVYFYDKSISFSTAVIAPNKDLNLEFGAVIGINYNFNLL